MPDVLPFGMPRGTKVYSSLSTIFHIVIIESNIQHCCVLRTLFFLNIKLNDMNIAVGPQYSSPLGDLEKDFEPGGKFYSI